MPDLLAVVAHDLRAPLTGLATASELLAEDADVLDRRQIRRMASTIQRGALWLQGLVENLLCAATVCEGRFRIQPLPLSLLDVAFEIEPVVEPLLDQKGLRLQVASRGALTEVSADGRRIGQALVNLISNAIKFSPRGTTVQVTVSTAPGWVRVAVADRGPGFPTGSVERVFDPFYRESGSEQDGVGLGLAIVKWIVDAHGGRVGARNRRGGGANVWFELPLLPAGATRAIDAGTVGGADR
ncbi:MAG: ATP-binding protein [Chloroflexota bacterium]|nr:ATP-binding protein [Chloroflexota bacterium]